MSMPTSINTGAGGGHAVAAVLSWLPAEPEYFDFWDVNFGLQSSEDWDEFHSRQARTEAQNFFGGKDQTGGVSGKASGQV